MTPIEFLTWLVSSTGAIAAVSWIAERVPAWHKVKAEAKKWYLFGASAFVSIGAWTLLTYVPPETFAMLQEPFYIVTVLFMTLFFGEQFHKATK